MTLTIIVVLAGVVIWLVWLDHYAGQLEERIDSLEVDDEIRRPRERGY